MASLLQILHFLSITCLLFCGVATSNQIPKVNFELGLHQNYSFLIASLLCLVADKIIKWSGLCISLFKLNYMAVYLFFFFFLFLFGTLLVIW